MIIRTTLEKYHKFLQPQPHPPQQNRVELHEHYSVEAQAMADVKNEGSSDVSDPTTAIAVKMVAWGVVLVVLVDVAEQPHHNPVTVMKILWDPYPMNHLT